MPNVVLDANLLILLAGGTASRGYLGKQRRLYEYSAQDFDLLIELIRPYARIIVTPNTLTEASNIIDHIREPARSHVAAVFRVLIGQSDERYVASVHAAAFPEFIQVGLSDCTLLHELNPSCLLLTTDLDLFVAASKRGYTAINFNHIRPK